MANKMKQINIGLLGAGTVGGGVILVLNQNRDLITERVGAEIRIKKVLARHPEKVRALDASLPTTDKIEDIVNDPDISIVVELMGREHPALEYMEAALRGGKNVVTANKDVVATHGKELFELAAAHHVDFLFEAAVAGGIPIIRPLKESLAANRISKIMGIINGTTNYMLTKMTQEHMDFAEVLKEAQDKGYAESDPTADVGGFDAARKIAILASIAFNSRVGLDDVYVEGIDKISSRDIEYADELGYVIKLLALPSRRRARASAPGSIPPCSGRTILWPRSTMCSTPCTWKASRWAKPCSSAGGPDGCPRPVPFAGTSSKAPGTSWPAALAGWAAPATKPNPCCPWKKSSPPATSGCW